MGAEIEGNKLFARGAMDMEAGIVSMIYVLKSVQNAALNLKGDIIIESVIEEEKGSGGTIATLTRGIVVDAAIVTETSGADGICIGADGVRWLKVNIIGKSEWPHLAHYGVNAIGLAMKIYDALVELGKRRDERLEGRRPLFETLGSAAMRGYWKIYKSNTRNYESGRLATTVAGRSKLQGRIGFPPSEAGDEVMLKSQRSLRS